MRSSLQKLKGMAILNRPQSTTTASAEPIAQPTTHAGVQGQTAAAVVQQNRGCCSVPPDTTRSVKTVRCSCYIRYLGSYDAISHSSRLFRVEGGWGPHTQKKPVRKERDQRRFNRSQFVTYMLVCSACERHRKICRQCSLGDRYVEYFRCPSNNDTTEIQTLFQTLLFLKFRVQF